nr:MAG TPA: hypothetical protein [Caudoviricetes sp.]
MNDFLKKPLVKILMLKGEKGGKGDKGEGIPTGGLTGQFLKKKSNTNYDYVWADIVPASVISNTEIDAIMEG